MEIYNVHPVYYTSLMRSVSIITILLVKMQSVLVAVMDWICVFSTHAILCGNTVLFNISGTLQVEQCFEI